jgi:hypothetical protein
MSHAASNYVKKLMQSPTGDRITVQEKCVLWFIADSHNEEQSAAWPSVPNIAKYSGLSVSRTREIIRSLIDKKIIWRIQRDRDNGSQQSNYWKFTEIDGEPPTSELIAEEKRRLMGRMFRDRKKSTDACESPCEIPEGTAAENRRVGYDEPEGVGTDDRRDASDGSEGGTTESRRDAYGTSQPLNSYLTASEPVLICSGTEIEQPLEAPQAAAVEMCRGVWGKVLAAMLAAGQFTEAEYLRVTANTREMRSVRVGERVEIDVGTLDVGVEKLLSNAMDKLKRATGLKPSDVRFQLRPIEKGAA